MKKNFLMWFLIASIFGLSLIGCPQSRGTSNNDANNPDTPVVSGLIAKVAIESGNGHREVSYSGVELNTKGKVKMQVTLKSGIDADNAEIEAKFAGVRVAFGDFSEGGNGISSLCNDVQGITAEAKEMVITVTSGKITDTFKLKLKEFDESTLQEIQLQSFQIGKENILGALKGGSASWRIYDPKSNEIDFTATANTELKQAIMVVNGKESILQPTVDDKSVVKAKISFEKNSVKVISFVFQAEGCKDLSLNSFSLTYTNQVNAIVNVDTSGGGRGKDLTDAEIMSGKVEFNKCTTTEPKITVKALKGRDAKLTRVTFDDVEAEIKTENIGAPNEEYVATFTLNPKLEKAGEKKNVKIHVEGSSNDGSKIFDPLDFEVAFTLVQFVQAKVQLDADAKGYLDLQQGHRVYSPDVKIKIIATEDNLDDVIVKNYKDANGVVPEFNIEGKEAIASIKLADTEDEATSFKVILKAKNKTDTVVPISVRYTAKADVLGIGGVSFGHRDLEQDKVNGNVVNKRDADGSLRMAKEKATLYILVDRRAKDITSIKVNNVEVKNQNGADPDHIITDAKVSSDSGPGGTSVNAVITIGGTSMQLDKVYTLNISLAGITQDDRVLSEVKLPPLKIKLPNYGDTNTDWRSPFGDWETGMDHTASNIVYHPEDKGKKFNNYYGVKSLRLSFNPKNPKATVKGFWYRKDAKNTERDAILKAAEGDTTYKDNWITFKEGTTVDGNSKWCFDLNLDDENKKHHSIGVFCYVVAADGSTTNKMTPCDDTIKTPYENYFHRLDITAYYKEKDDSTAMYLTDKVEVDVSKIENKKKLYFKASSYGWQSPSIEYYLFNLTGMPEAPISDLKRESYGATINCFNYFVLDVSKLVDGTDPEMEISIPVFLKGTYSEGNAQNEYTANVFTRKFKVVKKS